MPVILEPSKSPQGGRAGCLLLYDFTVPTPCRIGLRDGRRGPLATRRWLYLIPQSGEPRALVHAIEKPQPRPPARFEDVYAGRDKAEKQARQLLEGTKRLREYSPNCASIRVARRRRDIELFALRCRGRLVGRPDSQFESHWKTAAIATHRAASEKLYRIKTQAFDRSRAGSRRRSTTEYDIQQKMVGWFREEENLGFGPCVSAQ